MIELFRQAQSRAPLTDDAACAVVNEFHSIVDGSPFTPRRRRRFRRRVFATAVGGRCRIASSREAMITVSSNFAANLHHRAARRDEAIQATVDAHGRRAACTCCAASRTTRRSKRAATTRPPRARVDDAAPPIVGGEAAAARGTMIALERGRSTPDPPGCPRDQGRAQDRRNRIEDSTRRCAVFHATRPFVLVVLVRAG